MKNIFIFAGVSILALNISNAFATTFTCNSSKPTCEQMGYKRSANECQGWYMLHCPWDHTKVNCGCPYQYEYNKGQAADPGSNDGLTNPSCTRNGVTFYKNKCPGVPVSNCIDYDSSNIICKSRNGEYSGIWALFGFSGPKYTKYVSGCADIVRCEPGTVLYSDKTCRIGYHHSSTGAVPIGVVFDEVNKLAIALKEQNNIAFYNPDATYKKPSNRTYATKNNAPNFHTTEKYTNSCNWSNFSGCGIGGSIATKLILRNGTASNWRAANYCGQYNSAGTSSGEWFLPAPGDLVLLQGRISLINDTLSTLSQVQNLGAETIKTQAIEHEHEVHTSHGTTSVTSSIHPYYWSSVITDPWSKDGNAISGNRRINGIWTIDMSNGQLSKVTSVSNARARCVLKWE